MKSFLFSFCVSTVVLLGASFCSATPTTQIWNPSTDIQAFGTLHFGVDDYFTASGPRDDGYAFPTDIGLTWGPARNLEVGIDAFGATDSPIAFNAKFGIPENGDLPAFALGGFGFGTRPNETDQNIVYVVLAKTFGAFGRISSGYFSGNDDILVDEDGDKAGSGLMLTWDKAITDKLWLCVDHAGSRSALGATFWGFSWLFDGNTSVIFGYGTFNNGAEPVLTTQVDINI